MSLLRLPRFLLVHSLSVCYVTAVFWTSTVSSSVLLRHYVFYSRFPLFHHLLVTSVLCSRLRLSFLLFVTSLCFLLMVSIVSLSVIISRSLLSHDALQGFHCSVICLLRLFLPLFVKSLFIQAMPVAPLQANYYSEALQTQDTDVSEFEAEVPQATASEGLAQGPYVAAKTGLKPTTFQTKGVESTNEPPCPTIIIISSGFPLFYCLFITSLLCSRLRLSPPLFLSSLYYLFSRACFNMQ